MHSPGVCDYLVLVLPPCHIFRHQVSSSLSPALNIDWLFLFRLLWRTIICCSPAFRLQVFRIRINRLVFPPFFLQIRSQLVSPGTSGQVPRRLRSRPSSGPVRLATSSSSTSWGRTWTGTSLSSLSPGSATLRRGKERKETKMKETQ